MYALVTDERKQMTGCRWSDVGSSADVTDVW